MAAKFCPYHYGYVDNDPGMKLMRASGTPRWMCTNCQQRRQLPRKRLQELAIEEREARRAEETRKRNQQ